MNPITPPVTRSGLIHRRSMLATLVACGLTRPSLAQSPAKTQQPTTAPPYEDGNVDLNESSSAPSRLTRSQCSRGLLLGALIGDALGVPIEFKPTDDLVDRMPDARHWPDDHVLSDQRLRELGVGLQLFECRELRPTAEPFGAWQSNAPRGVMSDDSRMKVILLRACAKALRANRPVTQADIAQVFLEFTPHGKPVKPELNALIAENLSEYRLAANSVLDPSLRPPGQRVWGGVDNCSGQMMFPPLAVIDAGNPEKAYRRCYDLNFIDSAGAKDIIAAINAGLAELLGAKSLTLAPKQRWGIFLDTMRATDPYGYADVPFVGRRLHHWMDLAESIARRSEGRPSRAYRLLLQEGKPVFFWDAHFTLLVPLTMLHLCRFDPLAAMHLCLDFGHDTDSYAQILGAMVGAVHGEEVFANNLVEPVETRLRDDFGESVDEWSTMLSSLSQVRDSTHREKGP